LRQICSCRDRPAARHYAGRRCRCDHCQFLPPFPERTFMKNILRPLIFGCTLAAASSSVLAGAYDDLIAAVYRDDTTAVMDLVNRGMDVNSVDPAGNTLLHVAARNGNDALIAALIKQKANPNARNRVGDTPLALAAYNGKKA